MAKKTPISSHDEIIAQWEKSHRPKQHRSRLSDHETVIREKKAEGYTQQSIAELLCKFGCITTHQSISNYLKTHPDKKPFIRDDEIIHKSDEQAQKERNEPISDGIISQNSLNQANKGATGVSKLMQEIKEYEEAQKPS